MCCITMCYTRLLLEFALSTCVRCEDPFYNAIPYLRVFASAISRSQDTSRIFRYYNPASATHDFPSPIRRYLAIVALRFVERTRR